METNHDGFTYENWKHTVDLFIFETIGMGMDDLPDACHYDAWEGDCPPEEWAEQLLDENFGDAWR